MQGTFITLLIITPIIIVFMGGMSYVLTLLVKALKQYINGTTPSNEKSVARKLIGEAIKEYRQNCKLTQQFVAEAIGVSKKAVAKWEKGTSDPSTVDLIALAKLFNVSVEDLIKQVK
ncbi:MAG: transcriptional regulator [Epulopiscium sp. Nele67-Bin004]|nr:MAG: transcriptional regulator [Epulopiscium sp. Nele67-Bin004]